MIMLMMIRGTSTSCHPKQYFLLLLFTLLILFFFVSRPFPHFFLSAILSPGVPTRSTYLGEFKRLFLLSRGTVSGVPGCREVRHWLYIRRTDQVVLKHKDGQWRNWWTIVINEETLKGLSTTKDYKCFNGYSRKRTGSGSVRGTTGVKVEEGRWIPLIVKGTWTHTTLVFLGTSPYHLDLSFSSFNDPLNLFTSHTFVHPLDTLIHLQGQV